jgi:hypothetical protein
MCFPSKILCKCPQGSINPIGANAHFSGVSLISLTTLSLFSIVACSTLVEPLLCGKE